MIHNSKTDLAQEQPNGHPSQGLQFAVPQSRPRTYGISIKTNGGLDSASQAAFASKLDHAWDLVSRCQVNWIEPLLSVYTASGRDGVAEDVSEPWLFT